jgi:hypothetical protein
MIKDSGPKRVSILINRAQRARGLGAGPHEKRFRAKKSRLNLQSKLLHAGFTLHGPLLGACSLLFELSRFFRHVTFFYTGSNGVTCS